MKVTLLILDDMGYWITLQHVYLKHYVKMKRLFLSQIALAVCLVGCVAGNGDNHVGKINHKDVIGNKENHTIGYFHGLEVNGKFNVHFVEGKVHKVSFSNSSQASFRIEEGELKIRSKHGVRVPIDVYITAPQISEIELNGTINFKAKNINASKLDIDTKGTVNVDVEKISVTSFDFDNDGTVNFNANVDAMKAEFDNEGTCKLNIAVSAQNMELSNSGTQTVNLDFKGLNLILDNKGINNINAVLDCNTVSGSNFGTSKIVLSGKAKEVNIHPDNSTFIDTTKLNIE